MVSQEFAKKLRFVIILLCFPVLLYGQDTIYRSNETVIQAHIQDWNTSIVHFLLADQSNNRIHFLSTHYVDSIRFQNGQVKRFGPDSFIEPEFIQIYERTYLGVGLLDPIAYSNLRFTYERRFGAGSFSLHVPFTIGLGTREYSTWENGIRYRIGAGINFHMPRKRGNNLYVFGMGLYGGSFTNFEYDDLYQERTPISRPFISLVNAHSLFIRLHENLIVAPGVFLQLNRFGTNDNWGGFNYGGEIYYHTQLNLTFQLDILYNL